MNNRGEALAQAAAALVGCPFRLHGRDPASGLDCVGLVAAALAATGSRPVAPGGYGLRNLGVDPWLPFAAQAGLEAVSDEVRAGDVLLIALGFAQHHLVIAADAESCVHAHAGLGRVAGQRALAHRTPSGRLTSWRPSSSPPSAARSAGRSAARSGR